MAGALLTGAGAAHAQTYATTVVAPSTQQVAQFSTTTTANSPTFDRPTLQRTGVTSPTGAVSGLGTAVAYSDTNTLTGGTSAYLSTATGTYTVQTTQNYGVDANPASDYVQSIYSTAFLPASGATNLVQSYIPVTTGASNSYTVGLTAGTNYLFVDHGYYNATDFAANPADGASFGTAMTTVLYNNPGSTTTIADPTKTVVGTGTSATATYTPVASSQSLMVTGTTTINSFNSITIDGLSHSYIGDLLGTLSHNGVTVDLFDHVNAAANYGNGSAATFDGNNYTFSLAGASLSAVPDFASAPDGTTYMASSNTSGGYDTTNTANTLNSFVGQNVAGVWTLSLTDESPGDTGAFTGFSFNINNPAAAPEPSQFAALAIGALGVGGLMLRARRRRVTA